MTETNAKTPDIIAGKYEVIEVVGRGGMGTVYKALQRNLDRVVAIKMLSEELASDTEFRARFQQEATLIARLHHPNIIQVYDIEQHNHTFCIIMEFLEGESLQAKLDRDMCVAEKEIVSIGVQVSKALHHAHAHGIIHRDIKPDNIHISPHGLVKVMDFGIARYSESKLKTQTGISMGTPKFMSPEQVTGKNIDGQSDLYSLGVCLYACLAGRVPFDGDNAIAIATRHLYEQPTPPSQINTAISPNLEKVVMKALEKNKAVRWGSGEEFAQALEGTQGIRRQVYIAEESAGETVSVGATQRMNTTPFRNADTESLTPSKLPGADLQAEVPQEIADKSTIPNPTKDNRSPHDMPQLQFDYKAEPGTSAEDAKTPWAWLALAAVLLVAAAIAFTMFRRDSGDLTERQPPDSTISGADAEYRQMQADVQKLESAKKFSGALAALQQFKNRKPEYRTQEIDQRIAIVRKSLSGEMKERITAYANAGKLPLALAFTRAVQRTEPNWSPVGHSLWRNRETTPTAEARLNAAKSLEATVAAVKANAGKAVPANVDALEKAVTQDHTNLDIWLELASAYRSTGDEAAAQVILATIMERAPAGSPQAQRASELVSGTSSNP